MQENNVQLLCTRPLNDELIDTIEKHHISIDIIPFIDTVPNDDPVAERQIEALSHQEIVAVFTSMNAAEIVGEKVSGDVPWKIYSLGTATIDIVNKYFGTDKIAGTASDASGLAREILRTSSATEVVFFCGNQRREELPGILQQANMVVREVVVYETLELKTKLSKQYDAIAFFSPSAVRSFFNVNTADENCIFFAIGETTANELKTFGAGKVIISDKPGKNNLISKIIEHYS